MGERGAEGRAKVDEGAGGLPSLHAEEPPPFGGSWRRLYAAVLINLAVLVVLFHLFTRYFR